MPFELKVVGGVYRCEVCGRLITSNPFVYKTCCMNKPVILCSRECLIKWVSEWGKNQEQLTSSRFTNRKGSLRKMSL